MAGSSRSPVSGGNAFPTLTVGVFARLDVTWRYVERWENGLPGLAARSSAVADKPLVAADWDRHQRTRLVEPEKSYWEV